MPAGRTVDRTSKALLVGLILKSHDSGLYELLD